VGCDPQHYLVELRAAGPGPPAVIRLRRWLKAALRQHGLRCVSVREATGPGQAGQKDVFDEDEVPTPEL
jgi:hypothetical protein